MQTLHPFFKSPREIDLEARVAKLEIALAQVTNQHPDDVLDGLHGRAVNVPQTTELTRGSAPPTRVVPRVASIDCRCDDKYPNHLMVSARVYTKSPFGLSYYTRPGILEDPTVAARCSPTSMRCSCASSPSSLVR